MKIMNFLVIRETQLLFFNEEMLNLRKCSCSNENNNEEGMGDVPCYCSP